MLILIQRRLTNVLLRALIILPIALAPTALRAADIYQIIYASPTNLNSVAHDLNDHGVLLGTAVSNTVFHFTSHNGAITPLQSPAGTNDFEVVALNNHGHIIGNYSVPTITPSGSTYYFTHAFLQTATTNILFGDSLTNENSYARAFNDRDEVVGTIGNAAALFHPNTVLLEDPNIVWFNSHYGALHAINEHRLAAGHLGGTAAFWSRLLPGTQEFLPDRGDSRILALNNHGHMAGRSDFHTSVDQPFLRAGTNISLLGSHPSYHTEPLSINDHGAIVGSAQSVSLLPPLPMKPGSPLLVQSYDSAGLLWTNGVAVDLTSLLTPSLTEHHKITDAVAINDLGQIAATLKHRTSGATRAVILDPVNTLEIPPLRVVGPSASLLHTNSVSVSIAPAITNISRVSYMLYRRILLPSVGSGDFYQPPTWTVELHSTTTVSPAATFNSLPAGQYALFASVHLALAIDTYLPPIFFTIAAPPAFTATQTTFRDTFEFAINGGSAYRHAIEASSDLTNWFPIFTNSLGGGFGGGPSTLPQLFYRARVTSIDPEHFGATVSPRVPSNLVGHALRLFSFENQFAYRLEFPDISQVRIQLEESGSTNTATYTYRADTDRAHLHIDLPELQTRLEFQLKWSYLNMMPHDWRLTKITPTGKTYSTGRFFEAPQTVIVPRRGTKIIIPVPPLPNP